MESIPLEIAAGGGGLGIFAVAVARWLGSHIDALSEDLAAHRMESNTRLARLDERLKNIERRIDANGSGIPN